ncbi:MAG: hypothetical protein GXO71_01580 [Caldiserica bacterium]|nr:hypothetical protein [Caldisericota bacterium]
METFVTPDEYLKVLLKRKYYFIIPVIVALILGFTINKMQTPLYKATCRILIEPPLPKITLGEGIIRSGYYDYYYFQNQTEVIRSMSVAKRAAQMLYPEAKGEKLARLATMVKNSVSVAQAGERQPGIVFITAYNSDPKMAAKIANTIAAAYAKENLYSRTKNFQDTYAFLTNKLFKLKQELTDSRRKLEEFKRKRNVILVGNMDIDMEKLSEFNAQLISTKAERLGLEVKLQEIKKLSPEEKLVAASSFFPDNSVIQDLKTQLTNKKIELAGLLQVYKDNYPEVKQLREGIKLLEKMLEEEINKSVINLETNIRALQAKEEALNKAIKDYRKDAQDFSEKQSEYNLLQQEVKTNEEIYLLLTKKLAEADISKGLEENNVRVIDQARIPGAPVRPKKTMNLLFSLVVGLVLGVGLSYVREYMDITIRDSEEVEKYFQVQVLGRIPKVKSIKDFWEKQNNNKDGGHEEKS